MCQRCKLGGSERPLRARLEAPPPPAAPADPAARQPEPGLTSVGVRARALVVLVLVRADHDGRAANIQRRAVAGASHVALTIAVLPPAVPASGPGPAGPPAGGARSRGGRLLVLPRLLGLRSEIAGLHRHSRGV